VIKKKTRGGNGRSRTHKEQNGRIVKTGQKEMYAADLPPFVLPRSLLLSLSPQAQTIGKRKNFYFPEARRSTTAELRKQRTEEREAYRTAASAQRPTRIPTPPLHPSLFLSLEPWPWPRQTSLWSSCWPVLALSAFLCSLPPPPRLLPCPSRVGGDTRTRARGRVGRACSGAGRAGHAWGPPSSLALRRDLRFGCGRVVGD